MTEIYSCTPRQIREYVIDCLESDVVPFVQSSPGMGKSSIMKSISKEAGLELIDHRLSTSAPEDLSGLPRFDEEGNAHFSPFADLFPVEGTNIPEGKRGWMLFLDEFNSAKKDVQAAAYKLVLDRMTGQKKLHEKCVITAAGNLATDRAIVNQISTAMQSRVCHLEMRIDHTEWLYDVALKEDYDPRIIAFLNYDEKKLMDFRPDHNEKTFCCPRTWEFMNRFIKGKDFKINADGEYEMDKKIPLYAGTITSGVAVEFVQFTRVFNSLIDIKEILRDPANCQIPGDNPTRWAVISHMMSKGTEENFTKIVEYANRFPLDFKILFFRSALVRLPFFRQHPSFAPAMADLSRYLSGA